MSGIIGIARRQPADEPQVLEASLGRMADSLAHRGPDGVGLWTSGHERGAKIALGHLALHATPEAHTESLPLRSASGELALTCDARLDNCDELIPLLRDELRQVLGHDEQALVADSALILAAYVRWGRECAQHLLGDFAFAIWDEASQQLFCARDHCGVKPFYYFHDEDGFAFASEIKALFEVPQVERRVDEMRIAKYLMVAFDSHQDTAFEVIRRLPAAHTLRFDAASGQLEMARYWDLSQVQPLCGLSDREYESRFREVFFEAVRCRMRAPQTPNAVGGFLSGGMDSSAVMCAARDIEREKSQPAPLPVFSAIFDEVPECDERPFIQAVLDGGGLEPHWIRGEERSPLMDLEQVLWHTDEPVLGPNLCSSWTHYKPARQAGVRVILDGHGGDETVGYGLPRLAEMVQAGQWRALWRELRLLERHGFLEGGQGASEIMRRSLMHTLKPLKLARRLTNGLARRLPRRSETAIGEEEATKPFWKTLLADDFAERTQAHSLYQKCHEAEPRNAQGDRVYNERTLGAPLQSLAFEELNKAAAAAQVEARYPLWDKRLVELCLSMPPEQKLRDGWTRSILRRALRGVLPPEVQWRGSKVDFTPEAWHGLRAHDHARLQQLMDKSLPFGASYLDGEEVSRQARLVLESESPIAGPSPLVVRAAALECWLELQQKLQNGQRASFLDRSSVPATRDSGSSSENLRSQSGAGVYV